LIAQHVKFVNKRPRVIVTDFNTALYDTERFRPENRQYPTVYESIVCEDTVVLNTLIDQRKIETIFLLPDRATGTEIIEFGKGGRNSNEAFLINGDQLLGKPSFRTYASRSKQASTFVADSEATIRLEKYHLSNDPLHNNLYAVLFYLNIFLSYSVRRNKKLKK
jgi:hypothetical protein